MVEGWEGSGSEPYTQKTQGNSPKSRQIAVVKSRLKILLAFRIRLK